MREINIPAPGHHVFQNDGTQVTTTCYSGCGTLLMLQGARVCAILICSTCRQDPEKLAAARTENGKHMKAHTIHERQTNPWYPFEDFAAAWSVV